MSLCGQKSIYVIRSLIPSPDSSVRPGLRGSRKNTYKGRLNIDSDMSVLPKGRSFTANSGTKSAILPKGRSSIANSGT